ncbi:hypothetical protein FQZ97_1203370 [compost metagenome]
MGVAVWPKYSSSGRLANSGSSVQTSPTSKMPSRVCNSTLRPTLNTALRMSRPTTKVTATAGK